MGVGAFAGNAYTYGTIAAIVRTTTTPGWREFLSDSTGQLFCGIESSGNLICDWAGNGLASSGIALATNEWYCVVASKATGSAAPRYNVYRYSTGAWTQANHGTALANGSVVVTNYYVGSYGGSAEFWQGDIAAMAIYRAWVASDAEAQGMGFHVSRQPWIAARGRADLSTVWLLDQSATTMPVRDLTGGGANETGGTAPGVSALSLPLFGYGAPVIVVPAGAPPPTTDWLNPDADVTLNSWTTDTGGTTNLYQAIDEDTASDSDYVQSPAGAFSSSYYEVGLQDQVGDAALSTFHTVSYRYRTQVASASDITVSLRQGAGTEIASWAHNDISTAWTQADQTLSGGQADAITYPTDLRLRFAPNADVATISLVADRGSAQNLTGAASDAVDLAAGASITVGNYLIASISVDNSGTNGARPGLTVSDTRSNAWTVGTGSLIDPGAANAGSAVYIAYAKVANAYSNGDDLTFTWGAGNPPAKSIVVEEWTGIDATTPLAVAEVQASGSTTAFSIANTATAAGQLWYGACAVEGPTGDTFPADADVTALTRLSTTSGTAASNQTINHAYKVTTGSGAITWNGTLGTTRDWAAAALIFAPATTPRVQVSWAGLTIPAASGEAAAPPVVAITAVTPAVTPSVSVTAAPASVALSAVTPAVTPKVSVTTTPTVVALSATTPAVTPSVSVTVAPASVALAAVTPSATAVGSSTATPTAVAVSATTPAVTPKISVTTTATVVALSATAPSVTPQVSVTTTATVVTLSATVPAVTPQISRTLTATVVALTVVTPSVTPSVGVAAAPTVVALSASTPAAAMAVSSAAAPSVVAISAVVPAVTTGGSAAATPTVVAISAVTPAVTAVGSSTATPTVVALSVTFPAPVAWSALFGRTTIGGNTEEFTAGYRVGSKWTTSETVTVEKVVVYLSGQGGGTGDQVVKAVLYAGTADVDTADALKAVSNEVTVTDGQAAGWVDFTFASPPTLATGDWWLMLHSGENGWTTLLFRDSAVNGRVYIPDSYSDGPADPGGTGTLADGVYSMYAVGTAGGSSPGTATPATVALAVTLPAVTPSVSATVTSASVSISAVTPAVGVAASSAAAPTVVALSATTPAITPSVSRTTTTSVVAISATTPAVTPAVSPVVQGAVVALAVTIPSHTAVGGAAGTATPAAVALAAVTPSVAIVASGKATLTVVPLSATAPAVTATTGATASPTVVATSAATPTVTPHGSSAAQPTVVPLSAVTPSAAMVASSKAVLAVVPLAVTTPAVTPSIGITTTSSVVALAVTAPTVGVSAGATATPTALSLAVVSPAPITGFSGTATPAVLAIGPASFAAPTLVVFNNLAVLVLGAADVLVAWRARPPFTAATV